MDGHKVLKTLQNINSLVDDGPKDEITTLVWTFTRPQSQLSEDFVQGTKDFSDASFIRSLNFSRPEEAELMVNDFVEKTSDGKVKSAFKNLNSSSNLLFLTSFSFQGLLSMGSFAGLNISHGLRTKNISLVYFSHTSPYNPKRVKPKDQRVMVFVLST